MVGLTQELVLLLDEIAARRQISRSALIREIVNDYVSEHRDDLTGRKIAEGYQRIPPATPDDWGSLEQHADAAAAELLQRLDTEERREGREPW